VEEERIAQRGSVEGGRDWLEAAMIWADRRDGGNRIVVG
jgi:hypothetical protein